MYSGGQIIWRFSAGLERWGNTVSTEHQPIMGVEVPKASFLDSILRWPTR